jgi:hypothetical protein
MAEDAVACELVSTVNSQFKWEFNGNFCVLILQSAFRVHFTRGASSTCSEIPMAWKWEFESRNRPKHETELGKAEKATSRQARTV